MNDWLASLAILLRSGMPAVRVTVAAVRGSAPRETGASMLVSCEALASPQRAGAHPCAGENVSLKGTIGGGHLEWKAITVARQMLAQATPAWMDRYTLGASLGQCCGGAVELCFERYDAADLAFIDNALARRAAGPATFTTLISNRPQMSAVAGTPRRSLQCALPQSTPRFVLTRTDEHTVRIIERIDPPGPQLFLFGAGHVGTALVQVLGGLPLRVTWIDSREERFSLSQALPDNVMPLLSDEPDDEVASAPPGAYYLVLTHSHDLDDAICRAILRCGDFAWAGLIGSATKAASFAARWERQGLARRDIGRITCPIGIPGIASKHPVAIAVSVAAQLQQVMEMHASAHEAKQPRKAVDTAETVLLHATKQEVVLPAAAGRH